MKRSVLAVAAACCVAALAAPAALAQRPVKDAADHGAALKYLAAAVAFNKLAYEHNQEAAKELGEQYHACAAEFADVSPAIQAQVAFTRALAQGVRALELSASDYATYADALGSVKVKSPKLRAFATGVGSVAAAVTMLNPTVDVCAILRDWRASHYDPEKGAFGWLGSILDASGIDVKAFATGAVALLDNAGALRDAGLTRREAGFVLQVSGYGASLGLNAGIDALIG